MARVFKPHIRVIMQTLGPIAAIAILGLVAAFMGMRLGWIPTLIVWVMVVSQASAYYRLEYHFADDFVEERHWRRNYRVYWRDVEEINEYGMGFWGRMFRQDGWELVYKRDGKTRRMTLQVGGFSPADIAEMNKILDAVKIG